MVFINIYFFGLQKSIEAIEDRILVHVMRLPNKNFLLSSNFIEKKRLREMPVSS